MLFKKISMVCSVAIASGCLVFTPAGAAQQSQFVFYTPLWTLPGGSLNCSSDCWSTYNDDGSTEVDMGDGNSVLIMPDGSILGAP